MEIKKLILLASLGALLSACGDSGGSKTTDEADAGADGGIGGNEGNQGNKDGGGKPEKDSGPGQGNTDSDAGVDGGVDNNRAPIVRDAEFETEEDTPITEELKGIDPDGDDLSYSITVEPEHGTLTLDGVEVTYTPDPDFHGEDSFSYEASDGKASAEGTVTITVTPVNDPPTVDNLMFMIGEGATLAPAESLAAAGSDVDGDVLSVTVLPVMAPSGGSVQIGSDGKFSYVHGGVAATDEFIFEVCDPDNACAEGTVDIQIALVNAPPVAVDDDYQVAPAAVLNVAAPSGVLNNDSDPDNDALTVKTTPTVAPTNGTLVLNADGSFTYTNTSGTSDTFSYEVCDPSNVCDTAKVDIVVAALSQPPVAMNDSYSVDEGATLNGSSVLANDTIPTTATVNTTPVSGPSHGTLVLSASGTFVYTHDGSEDPDADSFTYRMCDAAQQCSTASVSITINPVNEAPVAVADAYTLAEGATLTGQNVLSNDTDGDSDVLTAALVMGPTHGVLALNANGTFTYTHDDTETASDSFSYEACDPSNECSTATVALTITLVNVAPVAVDDTYGVIEGGTLTVTSNKLTLNDTDADGDALTVQTTPVVAPTYGMLTLSADGTFVYKHSGIEQSADTFTYRVCDPGGLCDNAIATISVGAQNDPPIAFDEAYTVWEGNTLEIPAPGVLGNDLDDDEGAVITATQVLTDPSYGTVNLNPDGSFSYEHDFDQAPFGGPGPDSDFFDYQVCDQFDACDTARVSITIEQSLEVLGNVTSTGNITDSGFDLGNNVVCPQDGAIVPVEGSLSDESYFKVDEQGNYTFLPPVGHRDMPEFVEIQVGTSLSLACASEPFEITFHVSKQMVWFVDAAESEVVIPPDPSARVQPLGVPSGDAGPGPEPVTEFNDGRDKFDHGEGDVFHGFNGLDELPEEGDDFDCGNAILIQAQIAAPPSQTQYLCAQDLIVVRRAVPAVLDRVGPLGLTQVETPTSRCQSAEPRHSGTVNLPAEVHIVGEGVELPFDVTSLGLPEVYGDFGLTFGDGGTNTLMDGQIIAGGSNVISGLTVCALQPSIIPQGPGFWTMEAISVPMYDGGNVLIENVEIGAGSTLVLFEGPVTGTEGISFSNSRIRVKQAAEDGTQLTVSNCWVDQMSDVGIRFGFDFLDCTGPGCFGSLGGQVPVEPKLTLTDTVVTGNGSGTGVSLQDADGELVIDGLTISAVETGLYLESNVSVNATGSCDISDCDTGVYVAGNTAPVTFRGGLTVDAFSEAIWVNGFAELDVLGDGDTVTNTLSSGDSDAVGGVISSNTDLNIEFTTVTGGIALTRSDDGGDLLLRVVDSQLTDGFGIDITDNDVTSALPVCMEAHGNTFQTGDEGSEVAVTSLPAKLWFDLVDANATEEVNVAELLELDNTDLVAFEVSVPQMSRVVTACAGRVAPDLPPEEEPVLD